MKLFRLLVTGFILIFLTGCFQTTTVVRVNPDGSGTVEESMLLSKKMVSQFKEMMQGFAGDGAGKHNYLNLFEPSSLKKNARSMGKGVAYKSGQKVETADYTGFTATYSFIDINKLKLNQQSGVPADNNTSRSLPLTFHFSKGSPATLTIVQPKTKASGKTSPTYDTESESIDNAAPTEMTDENTKRFMELFMGMKFVLEVEINGTIIRTNATHREGNRLTLVNFDLAQLGNSLPEMEKLIQLKNSPYEESMELVKGIPGIKFDMNEKVTVVFRK